MARSSSIFLYSRKRILLRRLTSFLHGSLICLALAATSCPLRTGVRVGRVASAAAPAREFAEHDNALGRILDVLDRLHRTHLDRLHNRTKARVHAVARRVRRVVNA